MAKQNQFWDFIYLDETTGNKFRFAGNDGQSKKDAIHRLHALRANDGRKITILNAQLMEFDPCNVFYSDTKTMTGLNKDKAKMAAAIKDVFKDNNVRHS